MMNNTQQTELVSGGNLSTNSQPADPPVIILVTIGGWSLIGVTFLMALILGASHASNMAHIITGAILSGLYVGLVLLVLYLAVIRPTFAPLFTKANRTPIPAAAIPREESIAYALAHSGPRPQPTIDSTTGQHGVMS